MTRPQRPITGKKSRPIRPITGKKSATTSRPQRPITGRKSSVRKAQKLIVHVSQINPESLLDRKQVGAILGMSRSTIIRAEEEGKLMPRKLNKLKNGRVRYLAKDVLRYRDGG